MFRVLIVQHIGFHNVPLACLMCGILRRLISGWRGFDCRPNSCSTGAQKQIIRRFCMIAVAVGVQLASVCVIEGQFQCCFASDGGGNRSLGAMVDGSLLARIMEVRDGNRIASGALRAALGFGKHCRHFS
jgi:hypothetical protein